MKSLKLHISLLGPNFFPFPSLVSQQLESELEISNGT